MSAISLKIRASSLLLITASPERGALRGRGMRPHCRSGNSTARPRNPGAGCGWLGRSAGVKGPCPPSALSAQVGKDETQDAALLACLGLPCTPVLRSLIPQLALAKLGALVKRGEQPVGDPVVRHLNAPCSLTPARGRSDGLQSD